MTVARRLFTEKGFADTGTPEIVREAKVTRGALYHHFADKTDLFRHVVLSEAQALAAEIEGVSDIDPPLEALAKGSEVYFAAMATPGRAQLLLIEGPSVLGIAEMDRIDAGAGRASLAAGLKALRPDFDAAALAAMATVLSAAFDRAALAISEGEDVAPFAGAMMRLFEGLKD